MCGTELLIKTCRVTTMHREMSKPGRGHFDCKDSCVSNKRNPLFLLLRFLQLFCAEQFYNNSQWKLAMVACAVSLALGRQGQEGKFKANLGYIVGGGVAIATTTTIVIVASGYSPQ